MEKVRQRKILPVILLQTAKLSLLRMYNHEPDFTSLKNIIVKFYYY